MDSITFLPLSEVTFYILLSLVTGAKHGYAIMKDVEGLSRENLRISTSTLYDALERLLLQGLIERIPSEIDAGAGSRARKSYRLSRMGSKVLAAEIDRMRVLLDIAAPRLGEKML